MYAVTEAMNSRYVHVQEFSNFIGLDIECENSDEMMTSNIEKDKAAKLAETIARAAGMKPVEDLTYDQALDLLLERLSLAAEKSTNPNLTTYLAILGLGFVVDDTPATQEVVRALVGG